MTKVAPISRFTVNGNSMVPVLQPGQEVLTFNWAYLGKKPEVGDVVVLRVRNREMVKRVVRIMNDELWIMGDNKDESIDSRDFGPVGMDKIVGKVVYMTGHAELVSASLNKIPKQVRDDKWVDCPKCGSPVIGIYGRKDAICQNCGFKLACCGEP